MIVVVQVSGIGRRNGIPVPRGSDGVHEDVLMEMLEVVVVIVVAPCCVHVCCSR